MKVRFMNIIKILMLGILCFVLVTACQTSQKTMETAQNQYIQYCGACHGRNVEYLKEKEEWMFEKTYEAIYKAINEGVPEKNMPAYNKTFTPKEMENITKFVLQKLKN